MKGRHVVVVGLQPWDMKVGGNCKNIAIEVAKNNRVIYINTPLDRITSLRRSGAPEVKYRRDVIHGKLNGLQRVNNSLWIFYPKRIIESINTLPRGSVYNCLNKRNNRIFADEIKEALEALQFENIILFNDSLFFQGYYLKEYLKPDIYIYYIRDNLVTQTYFKKHGLRMEPDLAKKSHLVVANSIYLANYLKTYNAHSYMVGQGCDLSLFDPNAESLLVPDELSNMKRPIIGYVGYLTNLRLDLEVIRHLAVQRPNYSIALVGPEDEHFEKCDLHEIPNIFFLGRKDMSELPSFINSFDVAMNPQVLNDLTVGNYPRKIDEYLAMGKPTVATYTETMEYFEDQVYLSMSHEEFVKNVDIALLENDEEKEIGRRKFSSQHTWENNVKEIYKAVEKVSNGG